LSKMPSIFHLMSIIHERNMHADNLWPSYFSYIYNISYKLQVHERRMSLEVSKLGKVNTCELRSISSNPLEPRRGFWWRPHGEVRSSAKKFGPPIGSGASSSSSGTWWSKRSISKGGRVAWRWQERRGGWSVIWSGRHSGVGCERRAWEVEWGWMEMSDGERIRVNLSLWEGTVKISCVIIGLAG
jgi:hypothetical protein